MATIGALVHSSNQCHKLIDKHYQRTDLGYLFVAIFVTHLYASH